MDWPGGTPVWWEQHPLWTSVCPENDGKLCGEPFYFNFHTGRYVVSCTDTCVRTYAIACNMYV